MGIALPPGSTCDPASVPVVQWPRTSPFHGGNTGSNPVGDAKFIFSDNADLAAITTIIIRVPMHFPTTSLSKRLDATVFQFRTAIYQAKFFINNAQLGFGEADKVAQAIQNRIANPDEVVSDHYSRIAKGMIDRLDVEGRAKLKQNWQTYELLKPANLPMALNMSFLYIVALFDAFVSDAFTSVLLERPAMMRTKKKSINYEKILSFITVEELITYMANREILEDSYSSVHEQWKEYKDRFGVTIDESICTIDYLAEVIAQRNLLAHNNGVVNQRYLESVKQPMLKLGDKIQLTQVKWNEYAEAFEKISATVVNGLKAKFCQNDSEQDSLPDPTL